MAVPLKVPLKAWDHKVCETKTAVPLKAWDHKVCETKTAVPLTLSPFTIYYIQSI
jgi:hypothetical protein